MRIKTIRNKTARERKARGGFSVTSLAELSNIERITGRIDAELERLGCGMKERALIDVVIDEICSNVAFYAYGGSSGPVTVRFMTEEGGRRVRLTFEDLGVPFDPLKNEEPDITLPAAKRRLGGLGIFIVKKTMTDVRYERRNGRNILTVIKDIAPAPGNKPEGAAKMPKGGPLGSLKEK